MSKFQSMIDNKDKYAKFMVDEITHICKDMPKRDPGSEGEKIACEYMANYMKNECGAERADVEPFKLNPGSFYGWMYITITLAALQWIFYFFSPIVGAICFFVGLIVMVLQFGLYKKFVDFLFPEKTGHNVTAIKKCTGEVKARVFFNGHPDAAWNWPVNCKFGGAVYEAHIATGFVMAVLTMCLSVAQVVFRFQNGIDVFSILTPEVSPLYFWFGIATVCLSPITLSLYFMWDERTVVDGANDNLSGCYMGIAILKAMKDEGIELEHVEVGVILSGCEEAGLRGAKAWCQAHKGEFDDVPTWIYSYDTIHESKYLGVNYRDLNATVAADKEVSDSFMESAKELGIKCNKTLVPPLGGATDSAAFAQGGFRATGITALNHVLEDYYHTIRDTYTNMDEKCLADCYAISVNCLKKIDEKYSK